ncbi:HNH endonuclease signature motif containing protein [Zhihengliuella flava]|uniref:HNH nuclease domain-containing protein n=1 Tax=Zhihengliuella flava TaxID=1285193 RepID=A0A931D6U1_9MICC|nr:HNH endonuclease signature motif containing protein [Zhihengliuella flava]MBG6084760.1 hypothetical protein [Zhihengliuella flava]
MHQDSMPRFQLGSHVVGVAPVAASAPAEGTADRPAGIAAVRTIASGASGREVVEFAERLRSFAEALFYVGVMRLGEATEAALAPHLADVAASSPGMAASVSAGSLPTHAAQEVLAQEVASLRGIARMTAAHEVHRARAAVLDAPELLEVLARGEAGVRHIQEIVDLSLRIEPTDVPAPETKDPAADEAHERALRQADRECSERRRRFGRDTLRACSGKTPGQVRRQGRRRLEQDLPAAFESRHQNARAGRSVGVHEAEDGMSYLTAYLPTTAAEAIERRLTEYARAIKHPAAENLDRPVDLFAAHSASAWAGARDESRTLAQIRADALVDMLLSGPEAAGLANVKPHITVTVPAPLLLGLGVSLPGEGRAGEAPSENFSGGGVSAAAGMDPEALGVIAGLFTASGTAEAERFGSVSLTDLRALLPQASSWTRIITDPWTGAVTHCEPRVYQPPAALRRAIALRDRTCRIPGCSRRASDCEPDHVIEYQHGGHTRLDNLVSLCKRCHRLKSWGLLTLELSEDGVLDVETFWGTRRMTLPDAPWDVGTHRRKDPRHLIRARTVQVPGLQDGHLPGADLLLHGPGILDGPPHWLAPPQRRTLSGQLAPGGQPSPGEEQGDQLALQRLERGLRGELGPPF